jgi:hypothetical protein
MSRDGRTHDRDASDVTVEGATRAPSSSTSEPSGARERDEQARPGGPTTGATSAREVPVIWRDRVVHLRESARVTLRTVGTFRTVAVPDLAHHAYGGDRGRLEADVRTLVRRGWVERHTLAGRRGGRAVPVLVLSKEGRAFAAQHVVREGQTVHAGLVKPKEQAHDTALYRVAHAEGQRITRAGGTVRRVVLDAELKGQVASARNRPGSGDEAARTAAVARALHLRVIDGAVQIPDVRLEYETREGTQARVDLELATEHYKPSQVAAKAQAGFTIYAPASQAGRLSAALEDRGILAEILSL